MWSDILFWVAIISVLVVLWRVFTSDTISRATLSDDHLEALISTEHLQPGHYYLFVWAAHSISNNMAQDISVMLKMYGIDNGFVRTRGIPPVVYDLKRPEEPMEEVTNE